MYLGGSRHEELTFFWLRISAYPFDLVPLRARTRGLQYSTLCHIIILYHIMSYYIIVWYILVRYSGAVPLFLKEDGSVRKVYLSLSPSLSLSLYIYIYICIYIYIYICYSRRSGGPAFSQGRRELQEGLAAEGDDDRRGDCQGHAGFYDHY